MFTSELFRSERNYQTLHRRKALATLGTHFVFVLLKHFCFKHINIPEHSNVQEFHVQHFLCRKWEFSWETLYKVLDRLRRW